MEEHYHDSGIVRDILYNLSKEFKNKKIIFQKIEKKFYTGLGEQTEARNFFKLTAKDLAKKI